MSKLELFTHFISVLKKNAIIIFVTLNVTPKIMKTLINVTRKIMATKILFTDFIIKYFRVESI